MSKNKIFVLIVVALVIGFIVGSFAKGNIFNLSDQTGLAKNAIRISEKPAQANEMQTKVLGYLNSSTSLKVSAKIAEGKTLENVLVDIGFNVGNKHYLGTGCGNDNLTYGYFGDAWYYYYNGSWHTSNIYYGAGPSDGPSCNFWIL